MSNVKPKLFKVERYGGLFCMVRKQSWKNLMQNGKCLQFKLHEHSTTDAANAIQLKDAQNKLSDSGPISDHAAASTSTTSPRKMPLNTHTANNEFFFRGYHQNCSVINNSGIKFLYFNVRSLLPKIDDLRLVCSLYSPHVICIVESWLDMDSEICIQGLLFVSTR